MYGRVLSGRLCFASHHPVGVERDPGVGRTHVHVHLCGRGASLSFHPCRASIKGQLLGGGLLTVGVLFGMLVANNPVPVNNLRFALEVVQACGMVLLGLPLVQMFIGELISNIEPQHSLSCDVLPAESCVVRQPDIDILYDSAGKSLIG